MGEQLAWSRLKAVWAESTETEVQVTHAPQFEVLSKSSSFFLFLWLHWVSVGACRIFNPLTRDQSQDPCIGNSESYPLDLG